MSRYAWTIDKDHLFDPNTLGTDGQPLIADEAGTQGPRDASDAQLARLDAGEGVPFRMLDDDRILYYSGRIVFDGDDPQDDDEFAPLDDFGRPNAGAVDIQYRNATTGEWVSL